MNKINKYKSKQPGKGLAPVQFNVQRLIERPAERQDANRNNK